VHFSYFWAFKLYIKILLGFYADFAIFCPFFGDLEPDLRQDIGMIGSPTQIRYKSEDFDRPIGSNWNNDDDFVKLEAIFMQRSH
jgi:hypothetical protein